MVLNKDNNVTTEDTADAECHVTTDLRLHNQSPNMLISTMRCPNNIYTSTLHYFILTQICEICWINIGNRSHSRYFGPQGPTHTQTPEGIFYDPSTGLTQRGLARVCGKFEYSQKRVTITWGVKVFWKGEMRGKSGSEVQDTGSAASGFSGPFPWWTKQFGTSRATNNVDGIK